MKKIYVLLILTMLVVSSTGCRNGLFRTRGARCRNDAAPSGFCFPRRRGAQQEAPAPCPEPCPETYGPPITYGPYMSEECCPEDSVSAQGFETTPMVSGEHVMQRPVYSDEVVHSGSRSSSAYNVPGPEMAPLPPSQ